MQKYKTSEWVSLGHPDKMADFISEYILDRIIEKDPKVRYALEVQIKDAHVSLAGEITTTLNYTDEDLKRWTKEAVAEIGYTKAYASKFAPGETISSDMLEVDCYVSKQSPDISQGVDRDAWGDQGIFFGHYCAETGSGHGVDYFFAKKIGQELYSLAKSGKFNIGLDIKTQVTVMIEDADRENFKYSVKEIIVAVPTVKDKISESELKELVQDVIQNNIPDIEEYNLIINGTGAYHTHGPVGDSGTTGRKLVVDFYGSRSRIGGGSPWTKDGSKADLTLNLLAFNIARMTYNQLIDDNYPVVRVESELSCCIGRQEVSVYVRGYDKNDVVCAEQFISDRVKPSYLIEKYKLNTPVFAKLCKEGLFTTARKI